MEIIENFIPLGNKCRSGEKYKKEWIVIHETDNFQTSADAKAHAEYLQNLAKENRTYVSWHYTVDDHSIYQHIPDDEVAWHSEDGKTAHGGNMAGIAIEICVNKDGDYEKTLKNAIELSASLIKKHNLNIQNAMRTHFDFSPNKKVCPNKLILSDRWDKFKKDIIDSAMENTNDVVMGKLYRVQVGAYTNKENAVKLQKQLSDKGFESYLKYY